MNSSTETNKHIWNIARIGGVNRVCINIGQDILALEHLDQKLWTALSCPVHGLELDSKTLELIDSDNDNRIRVPEILAAVKWIMSVIKNPDDLTKSSKEFPLDAINTNVEEGKKLFVSAKQILSNIEKPDASFLTVEETSDTVKIFAKTKFNGDGIITKESTDDENLKNLITDIISSIGSVQDRSGNAGINEEILTKFYSECEEYTAWITKSEQNHKEILPFDSNTPNALAAYNAVKSKIDDYFIRCKLAEFDIRSIEALNLQLSKYDAISLSDLTKCIDEIAVFPVSKIDTKKTLSFVSGINPAWEASMKNFENTVLIPLFGQITSLTESDWKLVSQKFDAYMNWLAEKKGTLVESLGNEKIKKYLTENKKSELQILIDKDKELEEEANSIALVDKLVRYYRDLYILVKNFVTFSDFYTKDKKAIFQAGTLYIDQRSCSLCIRVNDMTRHNLLAGLSGIYLLYCDCVSKTKNEKITIVAAITNGDIDNLMVGRNALFYDRNGLDWDATVIKIIENPISIRQAFFAPYKKISKLIGDQIEKMASAKEKQFQADAAAKIEKAATKTEPDKKTPPQPFDMAKFVGIFAAIGLAIGAIGTALASMITGFVSLAWWQMPLAILAIMLIISGPSMILAWLKLRKRNLAPVLDANGWAINASVKINIHFGKLLTNIIKLPKNSKRIMKDPYSGKTIPLWLYLLILIIILGAAGLVLWYFGYLKSWGII